MKIVIELFARIAIWSFIGGLMAGAVWFGVYMIQGLLGALG